MKTEIINIEDRECIRRARVVLYAGGLVAFPTDTVYGIAAAARNKKAILKLYKVKRRTRQLPIPVLIASKLQLKQITKLVPEYAQRLTDKFWPGPITFVLNRDLALPAELSPDKTIGIRMPDHAFVLRLIHALGPLAVTSANLSGGTSSSTAIEVLQQLEGSFELLIDGGQTPGQVPSTVVDCTGAEPLILRNGPITQDEINKFLADQS